MGHPTTVEETLVRELFIRWLRHALRHMYDPAELRKNPLGQILLTHQPSNPSALRDRLVVAIEELKPSAELSRQSSTWRTYHTLRYRFVEQFSQNEVATNLGLSVRQLRRQEKTAIETLAENLKAQYLLNSIPDQQTKLASMLAREIEQDDLSEEPLVDAQSTADDVVTSVSYSKELEWISKSAPSEASDLVGIIQSALKTVDGLMSRLGVHVECAFAETLSLHAPVQPAPLRQAILSVLTVAINSVPNGRIQVAFENRSGEIVVRICPVAQPAKVSDLSSQQLEDLKVAGDLVAISGGHLEVLPKPQSENPFLATLTLPAMNQIPVLAIDDNADTLRLLQRYLVGTRYRLIGVQEPEQTIEMAINSKPGIIVLDAMLPGTDGWQLLGRFREHPRTRHIPIVICTILPQEQLARTLGAAGFLRKPVKQEEFLKLLDQLVKESATESSSDPR